jgi:hypothetical protein
MANMVTPMRKQTVTLHFHVGFPALSRHRFSRDGCPRSATCVNRFRMSALGHSSHWRCGQKSTFARSTPSATVLGVGLPGRKVPFASFAAPQKASVISSSPTHHPKRQWISCRCSNLLFRWFKNPAASLDLNQ